jgi:MoaA/NifB/PqqE/SkfB family radical SAM enzyme
MGNGELTRLDRLFLVLTNTCNARCRLCDYWKNKTIKFLSLSFIRQDVLPLIENYHVGLTLLTGGEPTLHPGLSEIVCALKETGTRISLITNGSRLEKCFEEIVDRIDAWMFSLDAAGEKLHLHLCGLDNFEDLTAWPGKIRKHNPVAQIAFLCLLQKGNVRNLPDLYRLAASLPVDALFFNVPDMKPRCFGRGTTVPAQSKEQAILDEGELTALENNLEEIQQLDAGKGILYQGSSYFDHCVRYFRALRSGEPVVFNPPQQVCRVPFKSVVIDEAQRVYPCFYLPYSTPFDSSTEDPLDTVELKTIRADMFNCVSLREKHCAFCLQYQG